MSLSEKPPVFFVGGGGGGQCCWASNAGQQHFEGVGVGTTSWVHTESDTLHHHSDVRLHQHGKACTIIPNLRFPPFLGKACRVFTCGGGGGGFNRAPQNWGGGGLGKGFD